MEHVCNDLYGLLGVTWHCALAPHKTGDHVAAHGRVRWPQHTTGGARWTRRHPGAMWHRIETSTRAACGVPLPKLTPRTVRGRTLATPPAGAEVCPSCLSMAPWAAAVTSTGAAMAAA